MKIKVEIIKAVTDWYRSLMPFAIPHPIIFGLFASGTLIGLFLIMTDVEINLWEKERNNEKQM